MEAVPGNGIPAFNRRNSACFSLDSERPDEHCGEQGFFTDQQDRTDPHSGSDTSVMLFLFPDLSVCELYGKHTGCIKKSCLRTSDHPADELLCSAARW